MSFYNKIHHTEDDPLTVQFFSESNVNGIQQQIINQVKHETGIAISKQSDTDLFHIMTGVMNLYSTTIHDAHSKEFALAIMDLNYHVIRQCADSVKKGILMHIQYLKDASTLPEPIPRSLSTTDDHSMRGFL
jgi:hypothetical protein